MSLKSSFRSFSTCGFYIVLHFVHLQLCGLIHKKIIICGLPGQTETTVLKSIYYCMNTNALKCTKCTINPFLHYRHLTRCCYPEWQQQRAKGKGQRAKGKGQRAEGRGQRAEGRGQRAEGRGQRADHNQGEVRWKTREQMMLNNIHWCRTKKNTAYIAKLK